MKPTLPILRGRGREKGRERERDRGLWTEVARGGEEKACIFQLNDGNTHTPTYKFIYNMHSKL
jgi:hypothetical protein